MKYLLALIFFIPLTLCARTVVDDYNRSVTLPDTITKIYAASPPLTMTLLAFDPELIAALNSPFTLKQKPHVGEAYNKPVVGGFGGGQSMNYEVLASLKPDVVLVWGGMSGVENALAKFASLDIPVVLVRNATLEDLVSQFRLLGELTHKRQRADELIAYTQETLEFVSRFQTQVASKKPKRYYFAEGIDGLSSECEGSFHLQPFEYALAKNALHCKMTSNYGMEKISAEQVMLANPDVIIVMEEQFYKNIQNNPRFASLSAVKNAAVYLVPSKPFNYITRPPSFMRLMGIRWLIGIFHPELLPEGESAELKRFQNLFFPAFK